MKNPAANFHDKTGYAYAIISLKEALTLFRMIIFRLLTEGRGLGKKTPLHKICHTYPTMINLATVIPYLKKAQKNYESRDTPPEFC